MSEGPLTPYSELVEILEALPLLVREKRRAEGLSLRQAADKAGISFSSLHRMEHRQGDLRFDTVLAAVRWLGGKGSQTSLIARSRKAGV